MITAIRPTTRRSSKIAPLSARFIGAKIDQSFALEFRMNQPIPLAFSASRLFKPAKYALFAELTTRGMIYSIQCWDRSANVYVVLPEFVESSYELIADLWSIFSATPLPD